MHFFSKVGKTSVKIRCSIPLCVFPKNASHGPRTKCTVRRPVQWALIQFLFPVFSFSLVDCRYTAAVQLLLLFLFLLLLLNHAISPWYQERRKKGEEEALTIIPAAFVPTIQNIRIQGYYFIKLIDRKSLCCCIVHFFYMCYFPIYKACPVGTMEPPMPPQCTK